jgi:hypothetical protein
MRFANGLLVRAGHEAEWLPFLEINVRGMTEHSEFLRSFLEGRADNVDGRANFFDCCATD